MCINVQCPQNALGYEPFSTSFLGLASAGFVAGVVGGFSDKSLIDGKLSRVVSLSDISVVLRVF